MTAILSYREQLRAVFMKRLEKNKKYSLRAFARDLFLDPGQLSLVLNGKKNISLSKASELSKLLFKNPREMVIFFHSVEMELAENTDAKNRILKKIQAQLKSHQEAHSNISDDEFEIISNWYNIPLLELAGIKSLDVTVTVAAGYFGITEVEALLGLEALTRLGFIKKTGKHYKRLKHVSTTTEIPSLAIKRFHQQMLQKSQRALFQQELRKRYISGLTISLPADKIDELKKMIVEHEDRLREFAHSLRDEPDQVIYQASTQLISLKASDYTE